jgi:hypothetical protein
MTTDNLTVLHSVNGKHAAKRFRRDRKTGEIRKFDYGSEKFFRVEEIAVTGIADLAAALTRLTLEPHAFVVRGEISKLIARTPGG